MPARAAGRWPGHTPDPEIRSLSARTWATATRSTGPSPTSPSATPTRTNTTTSSSSRRSALDSWKLTRACDVMRRRKLAAVGCALSAAMVMLAGVACTDGGTRSQSGATGSSSVDSTTLAGDTRAAIDASELYWKDQFTKRGKTFEPIRRIIPYTMAGEVHCGSEPMGSNNAAYCTNGDFIAFDAAWAKR